MNRKAVKTSKDEYLFLRQEILQYLNNYQSVRDMMYGSTLTCLGLGLFFEDSIAIGAQYLFLLPLIVIVPSFLVAVNFWKCVAVDAYICGCFMKPSPLRTIPMHRRIRRRWKHQTYTFAGKRAMPNYSVSNQNWVIRSMYSMFRMLFVPLFV